MSAQLLFPLADGHWQQVKDGDPRWRAICERHYSARHYRDGRRCYGIKGPGEYLMLVTANLDAFFCWRLMRFILNCQSGVNCNIFRNEGSVLSSILIREAMDLARERWPEQRRGYTYINPRKIRSSNSGCCFLKAGWRQCGWNQSGKLLILECKL